MKRVLISGGAGFIGTNLSKQLIRKGYSVTILDNLSRQIHGNPALFYKSEIINQVNFIKGDVCNLEDWKRAVNNQDAVVHLAAETGTGQSMYEQEKYKKVNIGGTKMLFEVLKNSKHSINKMVLASSRAIYGEGKYICQEHGDVFPKQRKEVYMHRGIFNPICAKCNQELAISLTDEHVKINPISIYGTTKYYQEKIFMQEGEKLGIPVTALRYQNVYGPGQSLSNPYTGILSIFSTRILNNNDIEIYEDGSQSRDFIYIDDIVRATIYSLEKKKANKQVFNVGTGKSISVFTVAKTLKELYKSDINISIDGRYRIGDIRHAACDVSKIDRLLGFKPYIKFEDGARQFANWVKTQNICIDKYEDSIKELKNKGLIK